MEKTPGGWTVIDREAGVLTHDYSFGKGGSAWCFTARMADGKLMVVSPSTGLTDAAAAELDEVGEVGAIVANNGFHHLGQAEWRSRYPDARCFAAPAATARIAKKSKADLDFEPISELLPLLGDDVGLHDVANTKCGECWVWAKIDGGWAYYVSDVLINLPELPGGLVKYLFKWTGSGPGFRPFNLALKFVVKDKKAALAALLKDVEARPPTVLVPGHGDILTQASVADDTRQVLQAAI